MSLGSPNLLDSSWVDNTAALSGSTEITTISLTSVGTAILGGIRVDGQILVDANVQDTVIYTPTSPYAVLTGDTSGTNFLRNGSLLCQEGGNNVYFTPVTKYPISDGRYYAESSVQMVLDEYERKIAFGINTDGTTTVNTNVVPAATAICYECAGTTGDINSKIYAAGVNTGMIVPSVIAGDTIGCDYDVRTGTADFYINGTLIASATVSSFAGTPAYFQQSDYQSLGTT